MEKMNLLMKKYKECVDHNSKSGRDPKMFPYFNEMQDMFGHWKNINCNHTLDFSFFGKKNQGSSYESQRSNNESQASSSKLKDRQQLSEIQRPSSSRQSSFFRQLTSPVKKVKKASSSKSEDQQQLSEKQSPSSSSSRQLSSFVEKVKKVPSGSKTKSKLKKQWLKHLRMLSAKNVKKNEKLIRIDERNAIKEEKLLLKQKQLLWKEALYKRKMENKDERHRDRMQVEKEKCQLLKDLMHSKNVFSLQNAFNMLDK